MSDPREWTSPDLPAAGDAAAAWAAQTLREDGHRADHRADALYVVTPDAGVGEALAFWADAQRTGLAFANPGAFPWTLANSIAGRITQELGIHGPCTTYVGGADDAEEARAQAVEDVADGVVERALVVFVRGRDRPQPGRQSARWTMTAWTIG